jgi:hypothetical protein
MCRPDDFPPYDPAALAARSQEDKDLFNQAEDARIERALESEHAYSSRVTVCDLLDFLGAGLSDEVTDKLEFTVMIHDHDTRRTTTVSGMFWDGDRLILEIPDIGAGISARLSGRPQA